jgi:hypothetical protein
MGCIASTLRVGGVGGLVSWPICVAAILFVDIVRLMFAYTNSMAQDERHRVYMSFMDRQGWQVQFLEADLKTPLPRKLHFTSSDKIIELVERGNGLPNLESRQALDSAIEMGRGGVFLSLTDAQYAKLAGIAAKSLPNQRHVRYHRIHRASL